MPLKHRRIAFMARILLLAIFIPLAACKKSEPEKPSISVFASPDDAGNALSAAAKSDDQNALLAIFGPDSKELIYSGDPVQDKNTAALFIAGYGQMHRWRKMSDGGQILLVGADNFPFPIPLKKNTSGKWFFDTAAGKDEVLNRRIGRNELAIIEVCNAVANAQAEYFATPSRWRKDKTIRGKVHQRPRQTERLVLEVARWTTREPARPNGSQRGRRRLYRKTRGTHRIPRLLLQNAVGANQ